MKLTQFRSRKYVFRTILLLSSTLLSSQCLAAAGDQYSLPKMGFMTIDVDNADSLLTIGFMLGFGMTQNISIETEANYGFSGGEFRNENKNIQGDYRIATVAAYGVYRLAWGEVGYLKLKGGVHAEQITKNSEYITPPAPGASNESSKNSEIGFAGGLGVGGKLDNHLTMELELTGIDQKIRLLTLGMHYGF